MVGKWVIEEGKVYDTMDVSRKNSGLTLKSFIVRDNEGEKGNVGKYEGWDPCEPGERNSTWYDIDTWVDKIIDANASVYIGA